MKKKKQIRIQNVEVKAGGQINLNDPRHPIINNVIIHPGGEIYIPG